jgi:thymidylate synthase (FAD)
MYGVRRSKDKKQGSGGPVDFQVTVDYDWGLMQYNSLIDRGVCPEQARMVLPQAMLTEWYWSGSLDAWANDVQPTL